jgi:DNA-binding response OmpR family regulator
MYPIPPLRLLIVEDDPSARANRRDILELDGYVVDEAGTLVDALDQRDWSQYMAVLIDRSLPDGRGEDLLGQIV